MKAIRSYAHEIVQQNFSDKLVCTRCGEHGDIEKMSASKCKPHFEGINSGWSGEVVEL